MPIRKIPRSYRSLTGQVSSAKNEGGSEHESALERDLLLLLEFDLNVARYDVQPLRLEYQDAGGTRRTYTPDVFVEYRHDVLPGRWMRPMLCEVKYRSDLRKDWLNLRPKFKAAVAYARKRGWKFKILTELEIRTSYLQNVRFLRAYRRQGNDEWQASVAQQILDALYELRQTDPEALLVFMRRTLEARAQLIPVLWWLVIQRMIGVDLRLPLNMHSPIWSMHPHQAVAYNTLPPLARLGLPSASGESSPNA